MNLTSKLYTPTGAVLVTMAARPPFVGIPQNNAVDEEAATANVELFHPPSEPTNTYSTVWNGSLPPSSPRPDLYVNHPSDIPATALPHLYHSQSHKKYEEHSYASLFSEQTFPVPKPHFQTGSLRPPPKYCPTHADPSQYLPSPAQHSIIQQLADLSFGDQVSIL
jgi:hypothetical protein